MIRKLGPRRFRVYSRKSRRNMGTFTSRTAALKRERQIQYFKRARG